MYYQCKHNRPEAIKTIVKRILTTIDKDHNNIYSAWEKAISGRLRKHTKPVHIKRGTLVVNVDNPGWLYTLSLDKERLLKILNMYIKEIKDIRLRIGEVSCLPTGRK